MEPNHRNVYLNCNHPTRHFGLTRSSAIYVSNHHHVCTIWALRIRIGIRTHRLCLTADYRLWPATAIVPYGCISICFMAVWLIELTRWSFDLAYILKCIGRHIYIWYGAPYSSRSSIIRIVEVLSLMNIYEHNLQIDIAHLPKHIKHVL